MLITRSGSLTALNALPASISSYDDVLNALGVIEPWLSNLEIAPADIAPFRSTDFAGSKLTGTLTTLVPKVVAALGANVAQSKALKKIVAVLVSSVQYLLSAEYEGEVAERIVGSESFERLLDRKLDERLASRGLEGGTERRSVGARKPRKERQTDLELHLHYIVHRSIHKSFDTGALTVVSDLKTWPDGTEEGFFEEVINGRTVRRWRPIWEQIASNSPFENVVVSKVLQEWPGTYDDPQVRLAFRAYKTNILREKKKQDDGRQEAIQAAMRVGKRTGDLLDSMRRKFEKSVLNSCADRAFYIAMMESQAFQLRRYAEDEQHGLPSPGTLLSDGSPAGYDGFKLFSDLWEAKRVTEPMWVAIEDVWWSEKARFAFYILLENTRPTGKQKARTPMFHLPRLARPAISIPDLPRLAPPPTSTETSPSSAKRSKTEHFLLSFGMINSAIVDDESFSTWSSLLQQDAEPDTTLPSLEEVLQSTPANQELARRVRRHMQVDETLTLEQARQLWRIRCEGSDRQYEEALRSTDRALYLSMFDWDDLGELYT